MNTDTMKCAVLTGGIGGAKLVLGLSHRLKADQLSVIVNTGDDFEHLGLPISPDLDTLMYTLSGQVNPETGWGLADESWSFMDAVEALHGESWFRLGDKDLTTHVRRRQLLSEGQTLTETTQSLYLSAGIDVTVMPMCDDPVITRIHTASETLDFQDYFVRQRAEPIACTIEYAGAESARASTAAVIALQTADLIMIAPSNPWLSIDPALALSDIKATIINSNKPVLGISPIVDGQAIKGPTAKLMGELGLEISSLEVARHYADILDGFIIDHADTAHRESIEALGIQVGITNTIMHSLKDKTGLADYCLNFAAEKLNPSDGSSS